MVCRATSLHVSQAEEVGWYVGGEEGVVHIVCNREAFEESFMGDHAVTTDS